MERGDIFEFTQADVEGVAQLLAVWLASNATSNYQLVELQFNTQIDTRVVIGSIEVDLEALVSSVAGLADPLGQIRQAIANMLNAVASQIIAGIHGIIDAATNVIKSILDKIQNVITKIPDALKAISDTLKKVVVDPIMKALQWVQETFPKIVDMFKSLGESISNLLSGLAEQVSKVASGVVDTISNIVGMIRDAIAGAIDAIKGAASTVASFLRSLVRDLANAISQVVETASRIGGMIIEGVRAAIDAIRNALSGIADIVARIPDMIVNAVRGVVDALRGMFDAFVGTVRGIVDRVVNAIRGIIDTVSGVAQTITNVISGIVDSIRSALGGLTSFISQLVEQVSSVLSQIPNMISSVIDRITSVLSTLIDNVRSVVSGIVDTITRIIEPVYETIHNFVSSVVDAIRSIPDVVRGALETITSAISGFVDRIRGALQTIASFIQNIIDAIRGFAEQIGSVIRDIIDRLNEFMSQVVEAVQGAVQRVVETIGAIVDAIRSGLAQLADMISNVARQFVDAVREAFSRIGEFISSAVETLKDFIANLPSYAVQAIENVTAWIWEHLPDWVKEFLTKAPEALRQVGVAITGFINAILKFPEWFPNWFYEKIAKPISDAIHGAFKWLWDEVTAAVKDVKDKFVVFLDAAAQYFSTVASVVTPGFGLVKIIIEKGLPAITTNVKDWIKQAIDFVSEVAKLGFEVIEGLREVVEHVVAGASKVIAEPLKEMMAALVGAAKRAFEKLKGGEGIDKVYYEFFSAIVPYTMSATAVVEGIRAVGQEVNRIASIMLSLAQSAAAAEGEPLIAFANILEKGAWAVVTEVPFSIAFWLAEPLKKPLEFAVRYAMRNELPIEIPTVTQIRDILRRAMAAGKFEEVNKTLIEFVKMRGYSDTVINLMFGGPEVLSTKITDRFGGERLVPLTLLWETPTRTDLVRMLQRDVLQSPMEWAKFIAVYGLNEDLGKLYYLASFEYPSFEKLWEFFVRGISGMLWYEPPDFIKQWFAEDAKWLGAGIPVEPKKLNYDYKALFKAIPFYLKWIQKSNFSWFKRGARIRYGNVEIEIDFDWTADSWLMWDIAADLPGKIDARWMAKWGLFDLLSEKAGISIPSVGQAPDAYPEIPFVDLVGKVMENTVASPVIMDLRAFSRLLVANGLHPAWVPITAVAEAINALSDERTLLRTGFINLFKEGFWSIETLDKLLEGFVVASFIVEYFDPTQKKWVAGVINAPVRFLPAERKLLELRALMDRALDILRDASKEAVRAFTENVVATYDEMMGLLNKTVESVNDWFAKEVRAITGKELKLGLDEPYWKAYKSVAEAFKKIFTIRRIRYWVGRVLGWLIYRLAYGYVKLSDIKSLADALAVAAKLTEEERSIIERIMEHVVGIARREYIPTPAQLATIAEVVPEAVRLAEQVFEARGVPEEWRPIWLKYIENKPIVDEVRRLVSTAITYYAKGVLSEDEFNEIMEIVKSYGWTDREIQIIKTIADIRRRYVELREEAKQYIPTPSQLATIAEVVPEAARLAEQVFEARHVPPEWRPIWAKYIEAKPIVDEVRRLLTAYAKALRFGIDLGDLANRILDIAKQAGWTDREIDLIKLRAYVEELIDEARELRRQYLPTPFSLATLAEYVEVPIELVRKALEARRVPPEWMELWIRYIQVRPLADEARMLATAFFKAKRYGVPLGDLEQQVLRILRELGFSERELQLRMLRATIEALIDQWREAQRQYIPTPSMLASIAEVVPEARKLLPMVLRARNVPREWAAVWAKYVQIKPIVDEVKALLSAVRRLYEYFAIKTEEFRRWLERLKPWGFEDREIQLILARSEVERALRAWRELAGDVDKMVRLAEYSPKARRAALALVERMIDALPTDPNTKEFLKAMWREYVKVRPVYDEVRRYITELISDYAEGVISDAELRQELEALKEWGIDDYEIEFYIWLAKRRRQRYLARRSRR